MFWSTVGRFIVIPIALLIAALVSGFVLFTLGLERITGALQGNRSGDDVIVAMFDLTQQGLLLGTGLTLIPALVVVIVGEIARIRSAIYYVAGGGLALAAMPMLARMTDSGNVVIPETTVWQIFATAGFVFVAYGGLLKISSVAEETRHPSRTIPLGLILSLGAVMVVFSKSFSAWVMSAWARSIEASIAITFDCADL